MESSITDLFINNYLETTYYFFQLRILLLKIDKFLLYRFLSIFWAWKTPEDWFYSSQNLNDTSVSINSLLLWSKRDYTDTTHRFVSNAILLTYRLKSELWNIQNKLRMNLCHYAAVLFMKTSKNQSYYHQTCEQPVKTKTFSILFFVSMSAQYNLQCFSHCLLSNYQ